MFFLSSLLCAHAAILIHLWLPRCLIMTFLFPVFGQFVPISWSVQSSTSFQVGFLIFCRHLFMPLSLLLLLLLLLWNCCSWQWWQWYGFFSLLVICFGNNSCKLLLYLIWLVGWQSPNCDSSAKHFLWAKLNNSVYYFVWPAVVVKWTVQLFTAGSWSVLYLTVQLFTVRSWSG